MGLETYQRNGILQEIVAGGLEPTDGDLIEGAEKVRVSHMPSGSYFTLLVDGDRYAGR